MIHHKFEKFHEWAYSDESFVATFALVLIIFTFPIWALIYIASKFWESMK